MEEDSRLLELSEIELAIAVIEEERKINFEKARMKEFKDKLLLAVQEEADRLLFPELEYPPQEDFEN